MTKKVLWLLLMTLLPLRLMAQGQDVFFRKGNCIPLHTDAHATSRRALPTPNQDWDANKTYKQMVILLSFSDTDFSMENPQEYYDNLFNKEGFYEFQGVGCVAEYFKEQSNGLFNLDFDIYGPVQVSSEAKDTKVSTNYGTASMREATTLVLEENPAVDYSQYDWDGDGTIEQVIYIYAGMCGNSNADEADGHIWPNTYLFSTITTPDGKKIRDYSASGEYWMKSAEIPIYCGIGTICHEFSHCLGLPDLYPTDNSDIYSAVDEWDLMDGGNFTNWGWCPPNYSPLEKILMGWAEPIELTEPTSITDLKPVAEGGSFYQIKHTDTEYLLLENRQQNGWDAGLPGKGLVIYYINYSPTIWRNNSVNNYATENEFRYRLFHADNMTYDDWETYLKENDLKKYVENSERMNNRYLSTSAYPYDNNDALTDTSTPAAKMSDETFLSKAINNIQLSKELIAFDFMKGETGIRDLRILDENGESILYNLSGQRVYFPLPGRMYIIKKNGITQKLIIKQ